MSKQRVNHVVLIILLVVISALFLGMTRSFLMPIFLAALMVGLCNPVFHFINTKLGNRPSLAAAGTILLIFILVLIPLSGLLAVFINQAISVSHSIAPWIQSFIAEPSKINVYLEKLPFYEELLPFRDQILAKAGQLLGSVSGFIVNGLSDFTTGALELMFLGFIMFYAMYAFFTDGSVLLHKVLYYLPLEDREERMLLARFTSVARATIKGTVLIGLLQGLICGLGYVLVDLKNPVFWAILTALSSVIPAVGTTLIWVPVTLIQVLNADWGNVAILLVLCGAIAGNMDNVLRPILVGRDTQMPDLMVLITTLGGIGMFGIIGIVIGPIIGALFMTLWDIYAVTFAQYLPHVVTAGQPQSQEEPEDHQSEKAD